MKRKTQFRAVLMMVLILLLAASVSLAQVGAPATALAPSADVGTAFSYQGQLLQADAPVNDTCDFSFSLWDAQGSGEPPVGGNQIGTTQTITSVAVADGLFTVDLDFGADAFTGEARWLQIMVDCGSGATTLSPRQPLNPAPYAMNADLLDGQEASEFALLYHQHWNETWHGNGNALTLNGIAAGGPVIWVTNTGTLGSGLRSQSNSGNGVYGQSESPDTTKAGVYGSATEHASGVFGSSLHGYGVRGDGGDEAGDYGGYFVGYAGVYGMGESAPGGYFESTSDDAVYADGDVTITGDLTVLGAANFPNYDNVVIVAKSGGDFTSIQAALDSITDASASNPYMVWVAPGIYNEQVTMKPYVDIRGAGELVTQISYTGHVDPYSGTVEGADNAELSYLTVINTGGAQHAVAIYNETTSPRLSHLTASASGGTSTNNGVYNLTASPTMAHMTASATGGSNSYGMYNDNNASPTLNDVTLSASGAATNVGLSNNGSGTVLTNVRARGTDGTTNYGVRNSTSLTMTNVQIEGSGGSNNYGIFNAATSGDYTVTINHSEIIGSTYTINDDDEFTTRVGVSRLDGGLVSATVTCAGVYDEDYDFYPDTCP